MKKLVLLFLLLSLPARAENYTISVTETELNLIGKALGKMPYEEVVQVINTISGQVAAKQARDKAASEKPKKEEDPPP